MVARSRALDRLLRHRRWFIAQSYGATGHRRQRDDGGRRRGTRQNPGVRIEEGDDRATQSPVADGIERFQRLGSRLLVTRPNASADHASSFGGAEHRKRAQRSIGHLPLTSCQDGGEETRRRIRRKAHTYVGLERLTGRPPRGGTADLDLGPLSEPEDLIGREQPAGTQQQEAGQHHPELAPLDRTSPID
jgi:hypothetical protein